MKVLSLFDGMACGYEALLRAGIKIDKYYASEIDKYAIQIAMKNHPDIIQIGDVTQVKGEDYKDIDLLIGGSPCQGFSIAGKQLNFSDERSKLFFEFVRLKEEIKPKYFLLENVKMKKEYENIISEYMGVEPIEINSALLSAQNRKRLYRTNIPGIQQPKDKGILLKDILEQEVDEKYNLTEAQWSKILSSNFDSNKRLSPLEGKSYTLSTMQGGYREPKIAYAPGSREYYSNGWKTDKSPTLCARDYKDPKVVYIPNIVKVRKYEVDIEGLKKELREHKNITNKEISELTGYPITKVEHRFRNDNCFAIPDAEIRFKLKDILGITTDKFDASITEFEEREGTYEKANRKISVDGKMTTLTASGNDDIILNPLMIKNATKQGYLEAYPGDGIDISYPNSKTKRGRVQHGKSHTLTTQGFGSVCVQTGKHQQDIIQREGGKSRSLVAGTHGSAVHHTKTLTKTGIRKLTPIECERLQTVPDNYTEGVSDSQRYKMLGNGRTVDVIAHIFSYINKG